MISAAAQQSGINNPLRFQGQYADDESGLHYNRHRYYDPEIGRFISSDPIGLMGGFNTHAYAPNPIGWIDPFGLDRDPRTGRFILSGNNTNSRKNRKTEYPSSYRCGVRDKVYDAHTIPSGPDKGKVRTIDGDIVDRNDPNLTLEHKTPVVEHWNTEGSNSSRGTRNDFYNNTDNLAPRLRSPNSSDGGTMSASGIHYTQVTGPTYTP